ncbi:MAG: TrmH family RNA methyltransferase [Mycoplasmatales bacterium]
MEKIGQEKLKEIVKLEQKKYRELTNQYLIFGEHLIQEALKYNKLKYLLTTDANLYNKYQEQVEFNQIKCYLLEKKNLTKFKSIANVPQLIGVCKKELAKIVGTKIIGFNKINNPGNLGTILRTAKAFGINDIILDEASVDLYNPKTIQAMQGVHFQMNIVRTNLYEWCQNTDKTIITTFLDEPNEQETITTKVQDNYLLIFGNEAQGIEIKYKKLKNYNFKLQIKYESLNVAIASGIIIYEMNKGE